MDGLISIIVPVHNVEAFLDECIRSMVEQTYRNIEIVLVDDGSTDNSPAICDAWAEKDSRIVVIHQPGSGVSVARNKGIEVSKGDYLYFVDSDDYIRADLCQRIMEGRRWMSWLSLTLIARPTQAATICPATVAMAAPATPRLGRPKRPKIKMGSRIMLMMAPSTWVHMDSTVRPVACSIRSAVNCR